MSATSFHGFDVEKVVTRQLGRAPEIDYSVIVVCPHSWPAVLENSTTRPKDEPNPNLYYLSCPYLRKSLSRLEDGGVIDEIQEMIRQDNGMAADLDEAQDIHRSEWLKMSASRGITIEFDPPLIAGAREGRLIKCLHAHYAYYLVHSDYRVGGYIAGRVGDEWCRDVSCESLLADSGES